jgi:hypothetical protein
VDDAGDRADDPGGADAGDTLVDDAVVDEADGDVGAHLDGQDPAEPVGGTPAG